MEIAKKEVGAVAVVAVTGNLDTNTAPVAQAYLDRVVEEGGTKILLDFTNLGYISSAGLRVLLTIAQRLEISSGVLRVCSLNSTVQEIFEISGFSTIFEVFDSESEALEGF